MKPLPQPLVATPRIALLQSRIFCLGMALVALVWLPVVVVAFAVGMHLLSH